MCFVNVKLIIGVMFKVSKFGRLVYIGIGIVKLKFIVYVKWEGIVVVLKWKVVVIVLRECCVRFVFDINFRCYNCCMEKWCL